MFKYGELQRMYNTSLYFCFMANPHDKIIILWQGMTGSGLTCSEMFPKSIKKTDFFFFKF